MTYRLPALGSVRAAERIPGADAAARRPAGGDSARGALQRVSLRFQDPDLERRYQHHGGGEGMAGFRIITGAGALVWSLSAIVIPAGTPIPMDVAVPIATAMASLSLIPFLLAGRAGTLDRQHSIASILTAMNALVVLWLASAGRILPGYGVSAILMLFAFGFVSRTGFLFAAARSAVVALGFVAAALLYQGPGNLLIDAFIFGAAVTGSLMALRLLEQTRRRVFSQDVVISEQAEALRAEKARSDGLLLNVIPAPISARLMDGERSIADAYPSVSVLFADIVGFTSLVARLSPDDLIDLLDRLFTGFDALVAERGVEKIKTMGDSYMVAGGLPEPMDDHAGRMIELGLRMIEVARREGESVGGIRLRIGVHTGPVVGGVLGHRKFAFDIWGETVNVASRLESHGVPNRVHVTEATLQLVEGRFDALPLGTVDLRGYGPMTTYAIASSEV